MFIETVEQLRTLYVAPTERVVKKQLPVLDVHCQRFIELSPFVVVSSCSITHAMDGSPRGGAPGFVRALNERTLLIPDAPGNNRLDTFENIIGTGHVGLLFMIPGVDETLRVNGAARLSCSEEYLRVFSEETRRPKLVIEVLVSEAYLHCPKAIMRSGLWQASSQLDRYVLPTILEMINDQTGILVPVPSPEEMHANFTKDL
jgi:uncharacterized protein